MNAPKASSSSWGGADVDLTVISASTEYAVGRLHNYVILIWRRKTVASGVNDVRRGFLEVVRARTASKLGFITVVDAECEMSAAPDVRGEVVELLRIYADRVGAAAVAFEGTGFRMTMVRSVITAINLASRSRFPSSVFTDKVSAALWLDQQMQSTGHAVPAARIVGAVEHLRQLSANAELTQH
jgi:hypothetical protein